MAHTVLALALGAPLMLTVAAGYAVATIRRLDRRRRARLRYLGSLA